MNPTLVVTGGKGDRLTSGDVRSVRRFSRHAKLDTLMVYDDNRADLAGEIARRLAAA